MLTDIRMAFASIQVNLPADADRAPFESVTLPETFELDALELDDSIYQTGYGFFRALFTLLEAYQSLFLTLLIFFF